MHAPVHRAEDGATRIAATFQNLGRQRVLAITPPADGRIRPGSVVGLSYSPATDDLSATEWQLQTTPSPPLTRRDDIQPVRRQGPNFGFTIPTGAAPGNAALLSGIGSRRAGVSSCEGAVECRTDLGEPWLPGTHPVFEPAFIAFTIAAP